MKDFNFFKPFMKQKSSSSLSNKLVLIGIISIIAITIYPIYNLINLNNMSKELQRINESINSSEIQDTIAIVREKNSEVAPLKTKLEVLESLEKELTNNSYINSLLLKNLSKVVPPSTTYNTLDIFDKEVYISGVSRDQALIATLARNLRGVNEFYNISIPNITKNGDSSYNFSITFNIKEVDNNEDK